MPWTDKPGSGPGQGGNGSGGGRGPWGQPPRGGNDNNNAGGNRGGGNNQSPDLEELLRSGRERFKRSMGGRGGSGGGSGGGVKLPGKGVIFVVLVLLVGLWAASGIYTVGPGERGVVTTFGKYTSMTGPGLQFHAPWPIQNVDVVLVTNERVTGIGTASRSQNERTMLTSDLNIVDVSIEVNWRIKVGPVEDGELPGPAKYVFNNEDPEGMVRAVAESALREVVGGNELDPIISNGRAIVPQNTLEVMQRTLDTYNSGIEIIRITFQRSDPPEEVIQAFRDVIDARSDAETTINNAQKVANEIVPVARGQAERVILDAEAYEAQVVAEARGQSARFVDIYEEYAKAPGVTRQRMYLETMERVLGDMEKIVVDQDAGGTVPFLNLNELTRPRQPQN
ncbi:FtsH protease activity modulator HflK [Aquisalinus flavus]|uniref:Protein HflK n=1 Tax=Aquisalinus flavus TaxID=1526572 RepID=A0A8J2V5F5_9PROT|nr:FtsH protease activity modulator HflK [Aquisalinus flavus]MBD0427480.1 FtsH protease activity modulator HflK [Aquisalinus flavus]UNE47277.1 FtsH protease activity modulator HflK [Aquisalinus flavus]GGD01318.1 protease modulator HflK [Aquisalinus flavus]